MSTESVLIEPIYHPSHVAALAIFLLAGVVLYRLYFHPLAKFPGPALAAITDYWELYQDFMREESGHLFLELDELHKKYGPVVRIRPNEVHVKDSHWMSVLYTGPSDPRDRDPLVGTAIGTPLATIGTGPHDLHRMRKAAIAPAFSIRSVSGMEAEIKKHVDSLLRDLEEQLDQVLDLRVYFFAWTTDFITKTIFHDCTNLFWHPDRAEPWFNIVWEFSAKFPLTKHMPWLVTTGLALPLFAWKVFFPPLVPYVTIYKELMAKATHATRRQADQTNNPPEPSTDEASGKDIFQTLMSSNLPDEETTPKRMANEVFNLLIAGSLTTSKTAAIAVFHVLDNPDLHQKLRDELVSEIPDPNKMLTYRELEHLPLLSSVIKETMRIGNVVTTRFPMIAKQKNLYHENQIIPAGSSISMTFCKAAMDPEIFRDPQIFRPERWTDGSQEQFDYERYVLPFGKGSRICIGRHLAYAQLYLLLASIFRKFDLELFETTRERDINVKGGGPLGEPTRKTKGIRVKVTGSVH